MSDYQVIARKYRPTTFKDVIGQDPIVITLKNAIKKNRLAQAKCCLSLEVNRRLMKSIKSPGNEENKSGASVLGRGTTFGILGIKCVN